MITAKIVDTIFLHSSHISALGSRNIQWTHAFDASKDDTVFFTDNMLEVAEQIECGKKVAILLEPPEISPSSYEYIKERHSIFDHIVSYSRELHYRFPHKCLWFPSSTTWIKSFELNPDNKKYFMSMIASNKMETSGQKLREEIIQDLGSSHYIKFFGKGRENELIRKEDGLIPYLFSVVIENEKYDDYFTEKILDCFATGTIPIYYGTSHIGDYFDDHGIIQFENKQQLIEIIDSLKYENTVDIITKYFTAMKNNFFETIKNYISTEDFLFKNYPFLFSECETND